MNTCKAWIKINTGMNRLGLNQSEFKQFMLQAEKHQQPLTAQKMCGLMSHLSSSEEQANPKNSEQTGIFNQAVLNTKFNALFPQAKLCLSNSGGIIYHTNTHLNAIRSGISCYGLAPSFDPQVNKNLRPVMTLKSKIIAKRHLSKGDSAGYNEQFIASGDCELATVGIGYGDGYPREAKNGTLVYVNDKMARIAGRVSMDLITIDVTGLNVNIGDEVELWGNNLPCSALAEQCNTISYDLLTRVSARVRRVIISSN
jgi:alanine racemase